MQYFVLDATATRTEPRFRGLAAKYVAWEITSAGGALTLDASQADVILATAVSPHEPEALPRALRRIKVEPLASRRSRAPVVVLGGQAAMSPAAFDPFVDAACVGEGRAFLRALCAGGVGAAFGLPNAWIPGARTRVAVDDEFPWDAPPTMAEDGAVRVYASRGCHKKCLFCHTGWSVTYREAQGDRVVRDAERLRDAGYRVNVVTNDAPALSFFGALNVEHFSASYSQTIEMLRRPDVDAFRGVRSVRFGVEAPSERLRRLIGKPISTSDLFALSVRLLNAGVSVRWFMIAGLPGETDDEYAELRDVVLRAKHEVTKGALQLSFTAFCPDAAAPLCLAPLTDDYWQRYDAFHRWFFEREGYTRKVQLFRCAAPPGRLRHAMGSMGATEAQLRTGWASVDPPNWRIDYPYRDRARLAYGVYARRAGIGGLGVATLADGISATVAPED